MSKQQFITRMQSENHGWAQVSGGDFSDDQGERFWQFRIAILPTAENLRKAADAIANIELLFESGQHPGFKLINLPNSEDLASWDGCLTDIGNDRDQRGKEFCLYMSHKGNDTYEYDGESYKTFALMIWKQLEAQGVQVAYLPPAHDENTFPAEAGIVTPFIYSAFKPYKLDEVRHGILHAQSYNPRGFVDPLANVQITQQDLNAYGIQGFIPQQILARQIAYGASHLRAVHAKLDDTISGMAEVEALSPTPLEQLAIMDSQTVLSEKLVTLIALLPNLPCYADGRLSPVADINELEHYQSKEAWSSEEEARIKQIVTEVSAHVNSEIEAMRVEFNGVPILQQLCEKHSVSVEQALNSGQITALQNVYRQAVHVQHASDSLQLQKHNFQQLESTFPQSYTTMWQSEGDDLSRARVILSDYTKGNSTIMRFFSGHWNRHHCQAIHSILQDKSVQDIETLVTRVNDLTLNNPNGSLARRLAFIVKQATSFQAQEAKDVDSSVLSASPG